MTSWAWPRGHVQVVYAGVVGWHLGKPHRQNITSNLAKVADDWTSSTGIWMHWKWYYHSLMMSCNNKQDLQEFCIFSLSYGKILMTLLGGITSHTGPPSHRSLVTSPPPWLQRPPHLGTEQQLTLVTPTSQISNILRVFEAYYIDRSIPDLGNRWNPGVKLNGWFCEYFA